MEKIDTLINARWVLPIAPTNTILENHSVAIRNGRIVDVLDSGEASKKYSAEEVIELKDHAVMPGLVNAHAHTPMNLFRGLADDLALMDWLNNHIWPAEQATINPQSVEAGTRLAIAEMIRGGTTCFNDHYFFPDVIAKVAIEEGMRACVGLVVMSVPTDWAKDEEGYFIKAKETLSNGPKSELIQYLIAPHAPYTVSDVSFKKIKALSDEFDLRVHIHMHESKAEIDGSLEQYGKRPLERLNELGLVNEKLINVHMTQLTDQEIKLVKNAGAHVVHCPESNLKLASGFCPVGKLLEADINVALATDGAASNNDLDMFGEMQTAAMLAKAIHQNPTTLSAANALKMATLNGAKTLGLENEIGSLEAGKAADIIAINLSSFMTQPIYNPMSQLVYAANRLQVSHVWINGESLLRDGEFTRLNVSKALEAGKQWSEKAAAFGVV